jgi:cytoskeletal protein CcmA (bactofilin family)
MMFTFRPGKNGNGQKNGNGGNGHSGHNGNGHQNGNGRGHYAAIESVIGPGIHWKGSLVGAGGIRIEGSFDGSIKLNGPLVIAEGAKVTADEIRAEAVSVAGTVKANIVADKVEILSTGRIYGNLTTRTFASEEGAFLRGQITMLDEAAMEPEPVASGASD